MMTNSEAHQKVTTAHRSRLADLYVRQSTLRQVFENTESTHRRYGQPRQSGTVGIVLGLEVSRLARNSTDWHRLLELCTLADTLLLDEDRLHGPAHFKDRVAVGPGSSRIPPSR